MLLPSILKNFDLEDKHTLRKLNSFQQIAYNLSQIVIICVYTCQISTF